MKTYMFNITLRVQHDGKLMNVVVCRGFRAETELAARREVFKDMLNTGFQVKRIDLDTEQF
jgi:hypothetical protein